MNNLENLPQVLTAQALTQQEGSVAAPFAQQVQTVQIGDDDQYQWAATTLRQIKGRLAALEEQRTSLTGPLNKVVKQINAMFKESSEVWDQAALFLSKAMETYYTMRLQAQAQARQGMAQAVHHGQPQAYAQLVHTALVAEPPVADGISTQERWLYEVVDENALPREFLMRDDRKIGEYVRTMKAQAQIPGVRVWPEVKVIARKS